jgi:cysteine desulfurase
MHRVYLDYAATTPIDKRVVEAMAPFWTENFGNAGGLYEEGRRAKDAMQKSRDAIAKLMGAKTDEIIFTSGGTESDNLAIFGVARSAQRGHIITIKFEHHAVLTPCEQLMREGFDVTFLDVGED